MLWSDDKDQRNTMITMDETEWDDLGMKQVWFGPAGNVDVGRAVPSHGPEVQNIANQTLSLVSNFSNCEEQILS